MIVLKCSMTNVCSVTSLNEIKIKWLQGIKKLHDNVCWEIPIKSEM